MLEGGGGVSIGVRNPGKGSISASDRECTTVTVSQCTGYSLIQICRLRYERHTHTHTSEKKDILHPYPGSPLRRHANSRSHCRALEETEALVLLPEALTRLGVLRVLNKRRPGRPLCVVRSGWLWLPCV
jgi:hypothetical protein